MTTDPFTLLPKQYDDYLKTIGEMSLTFSSIEQSVTQLVCLCVGGDDWEKGLIIVDQMQYRKTVDLLARLTPTAPYALLRASLPDLIPHLRTAGDDRNKYVHATMMMGVGHTAVYVLSSVRFRHGKKDSTRRVSLHTLRGALLRMSDTMNKAERLVIEALKLDPEPRG